MNSPENPKKEVCFVAFGKNCPEKCVGMLATMYIRESTHHPEGVVVEVCPNEDTLHYGTQMSDYCGNGADVMIYHQTTVPTLEKIESDIAEGWW